MIPASEIIIREAKREDVIPSLKLLKDLGLKLPEDKDLDSYIRNLWDNNPYFKIFKEDIFYGWVLVHEDKVRGYFGCLPRVYSLNGELIKVAIASQWGILKPYRAFTNLLADQFFLKNSIETKLVTTAIKPTGRIFNKYKGFAVPDPTLQEVYMVPLKFETLIAHSFREKKLLKWFAPFAMILNLKYLFLKKDKNFKSFEIENLPSDIDQFFKRFFEKSKGLEAHRSAEILTWFYKNATRGLEKKLFVYTTNKTTRGYCSVIKEPVVENLKIKRWKIIDLIAESAPIKKKMIESLLKVAIEENIDVVEFQLPGDISKSEIPTFSLKRELPQFPVFYQTTSDELNSLFSQPEAWSINSFDGDTCII